MTHQENDLGKNPLNNGISDSENDSKQTTAIPVAELEKMVADSLKDIDSDEESDGDDDADLLVELKKITGENVQCQPSLPTTVNENVQETPEILLPTTTMTVINIIKQRIEMYKKAEENAELAGDASKARRFNRGLNTLNDLLKKASTGENVNADEIPPNVIVRCVSTDADTESKQTKLTAIKLRKQEYEDAIRAAQRANNETDAMQFKEILSKFNTVIEMIEKGETVDLSDMPPTPEKLQEFLKEN